ncbi:MAG: hypothetical protein B6D64_08660 [Bacteroidetes bacterium 4484_276]|nr:MAG: hypothetical protein B6D64_08660 [Bacteroidetes bacterium 4484_276]OYT14070.1 MAG: hypothetical protein B6I19_01845 [Bacteroidetes bacterium 4572_114]
MLIFNSKIEKPGYLEKLLVGRKKTVNALEKSVITGAKYYQNIQHLVIGNRGSGKTHLMRVLFNRISTNATVTNKYCIAYMAEQEIGVDSFYALIISILEAVIRWNDDLAEKKEWKSKIGVLKEIRPADREDRAKEYILSYLGEKQLLILADNINGIFEGMKLHGQARFRDFIQQTDKINIIATNRSLFADIQREDKPFHNYFHIIHLDPLTRDETKELIIKLTAIEASPELTAHLNTNKGIGQIRSIHFLSEGNHRLIAMFFEFLKADIKSNLTIPFLKTLDRLKPYYESFIQHLPPQQQKIIHFLALKHQPQLGSAIAKECFLTPGGTSKQMTELRNKGFVDAHRIGRDNKYELSGPMMRYCIQLTDGRNGIIGMFVRFITVLFSDAEIINRYLKLKCQLKEGCDEKHDYKKQAEEVLIYEKAGENQAPIGHLRKHIESIEDEGTKSAMVKIMMKLRNLHPNCPIAEKDCTCSQLLNTNTDDDPVLKIFIIKLVSCSLYEDAYKLVHYINSNIEGRSEENVTTSIFFIKCLFKFNTNPEIIEGYLNKLLLMPTDGLTKKLISVLLESRFKGNEQTVYNLPKDERAILTFICEKGELL